MGRWNDAIPGVARARQREETELATAEARQEARRRSAELHGERLRQEAHAKMERQHKVAQELANFLASADGTSACALLEASGRIVSFGTDDQGGGSYLIVALSGQGLVRFCPTAAMDVYSHYTEPNPRAVATRKAAERPTDPANAVHHFVHTNSASAGGDPSRLMGWLTNEIEKIANHYRAA